MLEHKHLLIRSEVKRPLTTEKDTINWLSNLVKKINMNVLAGPYASKATTIPAKANIVVTAIAIPYNPAILFVRSIPATIINAGIAVASKEIAKPWITLVP